MTDASKGNPRAISVRVEHYARDKAARQRRHDMRDGPQPKYIQAELKSENSVIIEPPSAADFSSICQGRRTEKKRAMRSNAAVLTSSIITFGSEAQAWVKDLSKPDRDAMFQAVAEAVAKHLGADLSGLISHGDESAPHAHGYSPATRSDGKPLSKVITRAIASELQDIAAAAARPWLPMIERGNRKRDRLEAGASYADTVHRSVRQLHQELPADLEMKRLEVEAEGLRLDEVRSALEKNQRLFEKARADLTRYQDDAAKAEKIAKRLATYQSRAEKAQVEIEAAEGKATLLLQNGHAEAEELTSQAKAYAAKIKEDAGKTAIEIIANAEDRAERIAEKAALIMSATMALAEEIAEGTLSVTPEGRPQARNMSAIQQGFPNLQPAFIASVKAVERVRRKEAKAQSLIDRLSRSWEMLTRIFKKHEMPPALQVEGEDALRLVEKAVGKRVPLPEVPGLSRLRPAKKPIEPSNGSGPGF